jgi:hypothetical protein
VHCWTYTKRSSPTASSPDHRHSRTASWSPPDTHTPIPPPSATDRHTLPATAPPPSAWHNSWSPHAT